MKPDITKATPRPWHWGDCIEPVIVINGNSGQTRITQLYADGAGANRANAELICRAANAFDAMKAALEAWDQYFHHLDSISDPGDPLTKSRTDYHRKRIEQTREALALAKGE